MGKYIYDGPVMIFERCVANNWRAETIAVSPSKAKNNLKFRYKKEHNMIASSKVDLPGQVRLIC